MCCSLGPGFVGDTFLYGSLLVEVFEYLHEPFRREFCWLPSSDRKLLAEIPLYLRWRGGYWVFLNNPLYCKHAEFFSFSFLFLFTNFSVTVLPSLDYVGRYLNFQHLGYENSNHFSNSLILTHWKLIFTFAKWLGTPCIYPTNCKCYTLQTIIHRIQRRIRKGRPRMKRVISDNYQNKLNSLSSLQCGNGRNFNWNSSRP